MAMQIPNRPGALVIDANIAIGLCGSTEAMPANIKAAVEAYVTIVRAYQYPYPISVTKIEVRSWDDPENGFRHWTVTHWLDAQADQAMDYWDAVDAEIEQKLETLAPETADLVRYDIATDVEWTHA